MLKTNLGKNNKRRKQQNLNKTTSFLSSNSTRKCRRTKYHFLMQDKRKPSIVKNMEGFTFHTFKLGIIFVIKLFLFELIYSLTVDLLVPK